MQALSRHQFRALRNSFNMGARDLPDGSYARSPRAEGVAGIHIRRITFFMSAHITSNNYVSLPSSTPKLCPDVATGCCLAIVVVLIMGFLFDVSMTLFSAL